jgi:3-hydroxyacyl-CoA dehydrogenase
MSENFEAKKELYQTMAQLILSKTILITNSSTILPSKLAKYLLRPNKFLALHFANSIWKNNIVEVMCQEETKSKSFIKL